MKINDLFDCVYYINLDARKDRDDKFWELHDGLLDKQTTKRISAFDARNFSCNTDYNGIVNARAGISVSYIKPFLDALDNNFKEILILEDDAEPFFESSSELSDAILSANSRAYDILFLGGSVQSNLTRECEDLFRLDGNILATQAVAYNNRNNFFERMLKFPKEHEEMVPFLSNNGGICMDTIIGQFLTKEFNSFLSSKLLYGQFESLSDIEVLVTAYNPDMKRRFEEFSQP